MSEYQGERTAAAFRSLHAIVARLRAPGGCPWDREQTHESLVPFAIEEAYEVADAITDGGADALREELGDLLLQVLLHAQIADEAGRFGAADVASGLEAKLVRRHPHVFSDAIADTASEVANRWEQLKAVEKAEAGDASGVLGGVPRSLPALLKAQRLTEKAGRVGFDWQGAEEVLAKLREELAEFEVEVQAGRTAEAAAEFGDLLFVLANCARHLGIDAESALQAANAKFTRRFRHVEGALSALGSSPAESTLAEMDALWNEAKRNE